MRKYKFFQPFYLQRSILFPVKYNFFVKRINDNIRPYKIYSLNHKNNFNIRYSNNNRNDNGNNFSKNESPFVEEVVVESNYYQPIEKLIFTNNLCKLYENERYYSSKNFLIIVVLFISYLTYRFSKKVINHKEKKHYIRMIIYLFLVLFCASILKSTLRFSSIIKEINLCSDGKNIILSHPSLLLFVKHKKIDIAKIGRPIKFHMDEESKSLLKYGVPILADKREYVISRSGIIHNKEVFPVVLNGKYIYTDNREEIFN